MKYSASFIKTNKEAKQLEAVNATLLQKAGFIDQTMAGVYTFLPLGWRVLQKIEDIIRHEMDPVGAELLLPALSPRQLWETTKRDGIDVLFEARGANEASQERNSGSYILNPTHEDVLTPIALKVKPSYKDLPYAVYQIQTKFRNEERPKSGLLRGREFRMKDLYSFHATEEDLRNYYEQIKVVYRRIFEHLDLGADTLEVRASGGDFTSAFSHEFQTKLTTGEDTVYYDASEDVYYNQEIAPREVIAQGESWATSEVGNIFPLGTKFTESFDYRYTTATGQRELVWMASYGIGTSRIMGVLVEKFHDDRGIIWPASVAPYQAHLVGLNLDDSASKQQADEAYRQLQEAGVEVLYDDRPDASPGEKLSDADLIGCPWRLVVSKKTAGKIEMKARAEEDTTLLKIAEVLKRVQA